MTSRTSVVGLVFADVVERLGANASRRDIALLAHAHSEHILVNDAIVHDQTRNALERFTANATVHCIHKTKQGVNVTELVNDVSLHNS